MCSINSLTWKHMPCMGIMMIMHLYALPTLGLTLFCLWYCWVRHAEQDIKKRLNFYNMEYEEKGLKIVLVKKCCTSWIEFRYRK